MALERKLTTVSLKQARYFRRKLICRAFPYLLAFAFCCASSSPLLADAHTFDLVGPKIDITVDRAGKNLPISNVTELLAGDRLWIHPEFPTDQSVHYLLIVTFLQGPTNPPPESWFFRFETWTRQMREEGTVVTVPSGAEQALLFLAPETGGDFATLRGTVRGRPGVFVRAAQDLEQASLDRTRLDRYLSEITKTSNTDPAALKKNSTLLAQTLGIKVNEDCFSRPVEQQSACLTQGSDQMVLDNSHDQSLVATLTSGPSSDIITSLGASPVARGGYYSPYVGAIVDAVRLMSTLYTATYQYIPALSSPQKDELNLKLNAPPSFRNPKSVIVVGLPSIGLSPLPALHPVDPKQTLCLQQSPLVLPVEGAPLMFSTGMGHDFTVRLEGKTGKAVNLPATPDAVRGGFVVDTRPLHGVSLDPQLTATLHGSWGFSSFEGPSFPIRNARSEHWTVPVTESSALIAGRPATVHIQGDCAPCVEKVALFDAAGKDWKPTWKPHDQDQLEIELPLKEVSPGPLRLSVRQFGQASPDVLLLHAYSDAVHLEHFTMFAGDSHGILTGTHLEEVASLELNGIHFVPAKQTTATQDNALDLLAQNPSSITALQPSSSLPAHVALKDGRTLEVKATIQPPRPKVVLVSKTLQPSAATSPMHFTNGDAVPQDSRMSFFLKAEVPADFPRAQKIEVATVDGSFTSTLTLADGTLIPQDASSVLAVLDPLKALGPAAFGPIQFRAVDTDGAKGDWQALAILVRVPALREIHCPDSMEKCTLLGSNLFLLDSVASDPQFKNAVAVPAGFVSDALPVPRPYGARLYIKLRDDPSTIATVALPVLPVDH